MTRPNLLAARGAATALAVGLLACACGHSGSQAPSRPAADSPNAAKSADAKDIPYMVRPVIVRGNAPEATGPSDDVAAEGASSRGREAALRYMARRGGSPADATLHRGPVDTGRDIAPAVDRAATAAGSRPLSATRRLAEVVADASRPEPATPNAVPEAREAVPAPRVDDIADARSLNQHGIALINAGRPDQAIPVLERAAALQPRDAETLGNLGYAYMLVGENRDAKARLSRALDLAPTRSATWLNLGQTYAELGQRDAAVDAVVKGYRYSTRKPSVLSALQRAATGARYSAAWREAAGLALSRIDGAGTQG